MKRDHPGADGGSGSVGYGGVTAIDKGKMPFGFEGEDDDGDVDELLAALGYKVRASDMADVALKLEQLEMAMGNTAVAAASDDDSFLPPFGSDVVHYNPSDLSTWLDSMLSEINSPPPMAAPAKDVRNDQYKSQWHFDLPPSLQSHPATSLEAPSIITAVDSPRSAVYSSKSEMVSSRDRKRMKMSTTTTAEATTTACSSSSSSSREGGAREGGVGRGIMGSASTEVASEGKTSPSTVTPVPAMPVVLVDTQEAGIRLVHAMMACAEAVQQENMEAANVLVKQITRLAASQGGAMRKVAGYFVEALARRIYGPSPTADLLESSAFADVLHMHFYESCPYLEFAHFTANQAILEAFAGCRRVHVIDFGIKQGMQWPALLQALALRPGGPPSFRLTGIAAPQPDNSDALEHVGWKLARFAETIDVDFKYRALSVASLADLDPNTLLTSPDGAACDDDDEEPEAVAVNSVFELHQLLAHPGAVEKVLGMTRALRPRIVTVVEQEANHNSGSFVDRFTEALHYYSTMFDSLEGGGGISAADDSVAGDLTGSGGLQDRVMSEMYLGRQIRNVVACEGAERTERHERLERWRERMNRAGFEAVHLGSNAFKQARMLLALYAGGGDGGYRVEERDGCLTLGWHTCPVIATSAWCISGSSGGAAAIAGR